MRKPNWGLRLANVASVVAFTLLGCVALALTLHLPFFMLSLTVGAFGLAFLELRDTLRKW